MSANAEKETFQTIHQDEVAISETDMQSSRPMGAYRLHVDAAAPVYTESNGTEVVQPTAASARSKDFRIRFFTFNMGNNKHFSDLTDIQGPRGQGQFDDIFAEPFADGGTMDLASVSLPETQLSVAEWARKHMDQDTSILDTIVHQDACTEASKRTLFGGIVHGAAAAFNGNLVTLIAFRRKQFQEDEDNAFGLLSEDKVAGTSLPNPKKAFVGHAIFEKEGSLRLCFVGAHFPLTGIKKALAGAGTRAVDGTKIALAKILRKLLKKFLRHGSVDDNTLLFVQGDLNSRSVLLGTELSDGLFELLKDDALQVAITHNLPLPPGRWWEVVQEPSAHKLPVTYKFNSEVGEYFQGETATCSRGSARKSNLTLGEVKPVPQKNWHGEDWTAEIYKTTLAQVGVSKLRHWGLEFKVNDFKPFRFPASADRVLYWAPDQLSGRISWTLPAKGYEVQHLQGGSDHRPVLLDAILHVSTTANESRIPPKLAPKTDRLDDVCGDTDSAGEEEETTQHFRRFMTIFKGKEEETPFREQPDEVVERTRSSCAPPGTLYSSFANALGGCFFCRQRREQRVSRFPTIQTSREESWMPTFFQEDSWVPIFWQQAG